MDFNEIWHQQYTFIGVHYVLHFNFKILKGGKVLGVSFFCTNYAYWL